LKSAPGSLSEGTKLAVLEVAARCCLVAFFLVRVAAPVADLDNWHEMALIRESLAAGHLLKTDVFAYTPTLNPVVDHEWGAGALLYFTVKTFGGWAIVPLKFLVALLTGAAVLLCARLRRTGLEAQTVLAPLVIPAFSLGCATLRAQAYSFLFFAVLLYLLELDSAGKRRWIAAWMAIVVLWVNMHGGVVIGILTLGLYWVECVVRRKPHLHILGVMAGSIAAMSVNPYGVAYFRYLWGALRMARPQITEWYGIEVLGTRTAGAVLDDGGNCRGRRPDARLARELGRVNRGGDGRGHDSALAHHSLLRCGVGGLRSVLRKCDPAGRVHQGRVPQPHGGYRGVHGPDNIFCGNGRGGWSFQADRSQQPLSGWRGAVFECHEVPRQCDDVF
jgi:hypothetical protein